MWGGGTLKVFCSFSFNQFVLHQKMKLGYTDRKTFKNSPSTLQTYSIRYNIYYRWSSLLMTLMTRLLVCLFDHLLLSSVGMNRFHQVKLFKLKVFPNSTNKPHLKCSALLLYSSIFLTIYHHNVQSRSHVIQHMTHNAVGKKIKNKRTIRFHVTAKLAFCSFVHAWGSCHLMYIHFILKTNLWSDHISCSAHDMQSKMVVRTDSGEAALWL